MASAIAPAIDNLGTIARRRGDLDRAQALYEEALATSVRLGWPGMSRNIWVVFQASPLIVAIGHGP